MYQWRHDRFKFLTHGPVVAAQIQPSQGSVMKTVEEVLRIKEEEIERVRKEVEALRIAAGLLSDPDPSADRKPEYRQLLQMP
jgi:hypothetical protein